VFDENEVPSDEDMPEPETKQYDDPNKRVLTPTPKFYQLFYKIMCAMPANTILTNDNKQQITLPKLVNFVDSIIDAGQETMTVQDMNTILGFILNCPLNKVQEFADLVQTNQGKLWRL